MWCSKIYFALELSFSFHSELAIFFFISTLRFSLFDCWSTDGCECVVLVHSRALVDNLNFACARALLISFVRLIVESIADVVTIVRNRNLRLIYKRSQCVRSMLKMYAINTQATKTRDQLVRTASALVEFLSKCVRHHMRNNTANRKFHFGLWANIRSNSWRMQS